MNNIGDNEIINVSNSSIESESVSSSESVLSSVFDIEEEVIKKNIILKYVININNNYNYLNDNSDECLICFCKFKNNNIVLIQNNLCKCFFYTLLCEKCFLEWFLKNNKCFICRNSFCPDKDDIFKLFEFYSYFLFLKIHNLIKNNRIINLASDMDSNHFHTQSRIPNPTRIQRSSNNVQQSIRTSFRVPINLLSHLSNNNQINSNQRNRSSVIDTNIVEDSSTTNNIIILKLCLNKCFDLCLYIMLMLLLGLMIYIFSVSFLN